MYAIIQDCWSDRFTVKKKKGKKKRVSRFVCYTRLTMIIAIAAATDVDFSSVLNSVCFY